MNSHNVRKIIYENIKKEVERVIPLSKEIVKDVPKQNIYSKNNLYKYRIGNIYGNK